MYTDTRAPLGLDLICVPLRLYSHRTVTSPCTCARHRSRYSIFADGVLCSVAASAASTSASDGVLTLNAGFAAGFSSGSSEE